MARRPGVLVAHYEKGTGYMLGGWLERLSYDNIFYARSGIEAVKNIRSFGQGIGLLVLSYEGLDMPVEQVIAEATERNGAVRNLILTTACPTTLSQIAKATGAIQMPTSFRVFRDALLMLNGS